jgi:methyltransferase (TIGR00027 family)
MEAGRPSATAESAALLRAAHQLLDRPRILDDAVVLRLLGPDRVSLVRTHPETFETPALRRLRASIALRSRYAEDRLRDAVERGVRQYVILGAGLDSFAYRNPFAPAALHVYEVDHPDTQAWKRARLRDAGIALPASLSFVPVDFERQTLADALAGSGLDPRAPAFLSWLGVTVYLTRAAVLGTLAWVASLAPGSEIVFEYSTEPVVADASPRAALAASAAAQGEPWITFFDPTELAHQLTRLGFGEIEDLAPADAIERYFQARTDGLRPGSSGHLMRARVGA